MSVRDAGTGVHVCLESVFTFPGIDVHDALEWMFTFGWNLRSRCPGIRTKLGDVIEALDSTCVADGKVATYAAEDGKRFA